MWESFGHSSLYPYLSTMTVMRARADKPVFHGQKMAGKMKVIASFFFFLQSKNSTVGRGMSRVTNVMRIRANLLIFMTY